MSDDVRPMTVRVCSLDDWCDVCGRSGLIGVMWRPPFPLRPRGRVVALCHECVFAGAQALAAYVPPSAEGGG